MNQADNRHRNEVSWRAVLAGLVVLTLLAPACFYLEIVWGADSVVAGVPAPLPIVLLFLFGVVAAGPVSRWFKCTRQELFVVYAMLLVAAPVFSKSVMFSLIQKVVDYYYFGQNNPLWGPTFFRYIPTWWAPTDPQSIAGFFEGRSQVPWSLWWVPLATWLSFMLALWLSCFCILVLIRRQWITSERLNFPVAQIPLELVSEPLPGQSRGMGRLGGVFWGGFALALLLTFLDALAQRVPAVPAVPLGPLTVIQPNETGIFTLVYEVQLILFPWMLALLFLVPKEITFTAWFLWLVHQLIYIGVVALYGWNRQTTGTFVAQIVTGATVQGEGGVLALGLWVLWTARGHFRRVGRLVFRRGSQGLEAGEPLIYRLALIGLLISFTWMVCFCWISGCRLWFCVVLLGMIVGSYVFWARLRAETGLGFLWFPEEPMWILRNFGTAHFRPAEIVTLVTTRWASGGLADTTLAVSAGNAVDALKIGDATGIRLPRLSAILVGAFVFAVAIGAFVVLTGVYQHGYLGTVEGASYAGTSTSWQSRTDGGLIFEWVSSPADDAAGRQGMIASLSLGAALVVLLAALRVYLPWWPLHPMGYVISNIWSMHFHFFTFFIAWACKVLVIRYGGLRLYRKMVPLAAGLIVGSMLNAVIWAIVDLVTKMRV